MKPTGKLYRIFSTLLLGIGVGAYRAIFVPADEMGTIFISVLVAACLSIAVFSFTLRAQIAPKILRQPAYFKMVIVLASVLGLVSAAMGFIELIQTGFAALPAVVLALQIFAFAGMVPCLKTDNEELRSVLMMVPLFFSCMFLLLFYRTHCVSPHKAVFTVELFFAVAITLAAYAVTSMRFENRSQSPSICLYINLAVFFTVLCITSSMLTFNNYHYILTPNQLLCLSALCLYAVGWYCCPPTKYDAAACMVEPFGEAASDDSFIGDEGDMLSLNSILAEAREYQAAEDETPAIKPAEAKDPDNK